MLLRSLLIVSLPLALSCNAKKDALEEKKDLSFVKIALTNLDRSFRDHNKGDIERYWQDIIKNDSDVIDYLIDSASEILENFYWYDTTKRSSQPRVYKKVSMDLSRLYLICAIYYKDLFFAFDRNIYSNSELTDFDDISELEKFKLIREAKMVVTLDSVWNSVLNWRLSDRKQRPFFKTTYYWFGEKGGKLSFENSFGYHLP